MWNAAWRPLSKVGRRRNYPKARELSMSKTLLLLADGFETYEASVFIDVLGWNLADGDGTTELVTCAIRKNIRRPGRFH
jgi:hypothetical protein